MSHLCSKHWHGVQTRALLSPVVVVVGFRCGDGGGGGVGVDGNTINRCAHV